MTYAVDKLLSGQKRNQVKDTGAKICEKQSIEISQRTSIHVSLPNLTADTPSYFTDQRQGETARRNVCFRKNTSKNLKVSSCYLMSSIVLLVIREASGIVESNGGFDF